MSFSHARNIDIFKKCWKRFAKTPLLNNDLKNPKNALWIQAHHFPHTFSVPEVSSRDPRYIDTFKKCWKRFTKTPLLNNDLKNPKNALWLQAYHFFHTFSVPEISFSDARNIETLKKCWKRFTKTPLLNNDLKNPKNAICIQANHFCHTFTVPEISSSNTRHIDTFKKCWKRFTKTPSLNNDLKNPKNAL